MKLKKLQMGGYVPSQDSRSRYYTSPEVHKAQQQGEAKINDSGLLEFIPIYGTYKSAERFVEDPSVMKGAETVISGIGDIATGGLLGYATKGVKYYNKARKAQKPYKKLRQEEQKFIKSKLESAPEQRAALIKKQRQVANSLSLMEPTPKVRQEILKRQRKINWLKEASPRELFPNIYHTTGELFGNRIRDISEKYIMPNVWQYRDAFNNAKQWGTIAIPANVIKGGLRTTDPNSTFYNNIFDPQPFKNQSRKLIL